MLLSFRQILDHGELCLVYDESDDSGAGLPERGYMAPKERWQKALKLVQVRLTFQSSP